MRILLVTRGLPASGKSSWVKENHLTPYTLSPDYLRLLASSPLEDLEGKWHIHQKNDDVIWACFYQLLEARLKNGDFTVIDATHTVLNNLNLYEKLAHLYDYSLYIVDFTHVPFELCCQYNDQRMKENGFCVPLSVMIHMQKQLDSTHLPKRFRTLQPKEWQQVLVTPKDLSQYKKIYHIGDLQGCYSVLAQNLGEIRSDCFYVFLGDYIDRGIENALLLRYLLEICELPNVWLLEGNHERHLRKFAQGEVSSSKEFRENTQKDIEAHNITPKEISRLCHRLRPYLLYRYHDKLALCSHAGIPRVPEDLSKLTFIPAQTFIDGIGGYSDTRKVAEIFTNSTPSYLYQIFGHRNKENLPTQVTERVFVCEGGVEFGGDLRIVCLDSSGFECLSYPNTVFKAAKNQSDSLAISKLIYEFMESEWVRQKSFGDVTSFSFSKQAFSKGVWNRITCKARGIFIDTKKEVIVARSYEKFFNFAEMDFTQPSSLKENLKFPVSVYLKENGFLGMVAYYNNDLFITSKNDKDSVFAKRLEKQVESLGIRERLLAFFAQYPCCTLIFEVIDPIHDPHIIAYNKAELVLLDVVYNSVSFSCLSYQEVKRHAKTLGVSCKKKIATLHDYKELEQFMLHQRIGKLGNCYVEGFVICDNVHFMFKLKGEYYQHWKKMRGVIGSHSAVIKKLLNEQQDIQERLEELAFVNGDSKNYAQGQDFVDVSVFVAWWAKKALGFLGDFEGLKQFLHSDIITLREQFMVENAPKNCLF